MATTPILALLEEHTKNIKISAGVTNNVGDTTPPSDIDALERKWEGELRRLSERIEGRAMFTGRRWFRYHREY